MKFRSTRRSNPIPLLHWEELVRSSPCPFLDIYCYTLLQRAVVIQIQGWSPSIHSSGIDSTPQAQQCLQLRNESGISACLYEPIIYI